MNRYKLKSIRVLKGIKQGEFAKELGITPQHLCKIEKGEVEPRRDLMKKISTILGLTIQEIFFSEENQQ